MRYISDYDLKLYQNDGVVRHAFKNGVLDLGTSTIDATLDTTDLGIGLQRPYTEDLNGTATVLIQLVGQGDLTEANGKRLFYEAPLLTEGDIATAGDNLWYQVIDGVIVYDSHTFYPGDKFQYKDAALLATLLTTDILSITLPPVPEGVDRNGEFFKQHLLHGDEPKEYFVLNKAGFIPRDGLDTATLEEGYNYIR
jgi:hypothetical protein